MRCMHSLRRFLVATTALLLAAARTDADTSTPAETSGPCTAEVARFCKDVARGEGRLRTCLLAHAKELAPACRARLEAPPAGEAKAGPPIGPPAMRDCEPDLRAHCAKIERGAGRLRGCLDSYADKLTPRCKAWLAKPRDARTAP